MATTTKIRATFVDSKRTYTISGLKNTATPNDLYITAQGFLQLQENYDYLTKVTETDLI